MAHQFEIGKIYSARSACDHECIFSFKVIARTAKQLTLQDKHGEISKRGVRTYDGIEVCSPFGRYSMSPTIYANREAA